MAKLLFLSILGYPTHFGQMEAIKLLASPRFSDKRMGYLALGLLVDEKHEVLTLVTNCLSQDLAAPSQFTAGLAITALGTLGSAEMARDLCGDLEKHLRGANPYLRKKARQWRRGGGGGWKKAPGDPPPPPYLSPSHPPARSLARPRSRRCAC